jgi:hypothetical protein
MTALIRMRLIAYVRTGRFILPLLSEMVLLSVFYGGGRSGAAEAYGISALLLFPVVAWQTKLLLDAEPDVQRRLALAALGSRTRELTAGLVAAAIAAVPLVLVALVMPWLFGAVTSAGAGSGVALGVWAHAIIIPAAVAIGALSSRPIAGSAGRATAVLASGVVLAFVLGLHGSPVPWLAPPLVTTAKTLADGAGAAAVAGLTAWALVWGAVAVAGYGWLRRSRA